MEKGFIVMISVFLLITVIHFVSLKLIRSSEERKERLRTVFFYIYGAVYAIIGAIQLELNDGEGIFYILQIASGIAFIILNYFGKLNFNK
ncbi:hypothetical protein N9R22_03290 [Flavobacteriaceae bacterium]|jgi:hypothetical protein|nr:hypothetical protein [Flavobacteriaceae bacterium]MDB4067366.1 hypothetical protein [Flavobacteriaceae bacterium]MDB4152656.1 hypothetical protein [Flavobacteriaceae bacterium]MDB9988162.1 hypothetical protein [Flavobacteriaceae bacterium]|tara:strand:+ start:3961 stop:4230 length:270 start_codon:yes stop_codon:yes gene_type:complete